MEHVVMKLVSLVSSAHLWVGGSALGEHVHHLREATCRASLFCKILGIRQGVDVGAIGTYVTENCVYRVHSAVRWTSYSHAL